MLTESQDPGILKYEDAKLIEVLRSVLEVALEDQDVSAEELSLIRRLREKRQG